MPQDLSNMCCIHCNQPIDGSERNAFVTDGRTHGYVHKGCLKAWQEANPEGTVFRWPKKGC